MCVEGYFVISKLWFGYSSLLLEVTLCALTHYLLMANHYDSAKMVVQSIYKVQDLSKMQRLHQ